MFTPTLPGHGDLDLDILIMDGVMAVGTGAIPDTPGVVTLDIGDLVTDMDGITRDITGEEDMVTDITITLIIMEEEVLPHTTVEEITPQTEVTQQIETFLTEAILTLIETTPTEVIITQTDEASILISEEAPL